MLIATILLLTLVANAAQASQANAPVTAAEAQRLLVEGKFEQARDAYEQLLLTQPGDAAAQEGLAEATERLALKERAAGHRDAALAALLHAQKVEPDNRRVLFDLGVLEEEMSLFQDAEAVLTHLETLKPIDANTYYALGRVYLDQGKLDAARAEMQAFLALRPDDASAQFGLGKIDLQALHFDAAQAEFERSIVLQPKQTEAYYQLGLVFLEQNRFEECIRQFNKVLERNPQHGGALVGAGTAYFKLKQYDKAKDWLTQGTLAAPEYQPGHYYLGLTLARLGDTPGSQRELSIATTLADKENEQAANRLRIQNPEGRP